MYLKRILVANSPNTCNSYLNITFTTEKYNEDVLLSVSDINGKTLRQIELSHGAGLQSYNMSTTDLINGTYIIKILIRNKFEELKFIVYR